MYFFKRLCDGSRARSPIRDVPRKAGAQKYDPEPPRESCNRVAFAAFYAAISPPDSTSFRSCSSIDYNVNDRPQHRLPNDKQGQDTTRMLHLNKIRNPGDYIFYICSCCGEERSC